MNRKTNQTLLERVRNKTKTEQQHNKRQQTLLKQHLTNYKEVKAHYLHSKPNSLKISLFV